MRQSCKIACFTSLMFVMVVAELPAQEAKPAAEEKITYDQHILPIFREKCGTCHNPNDKNGDLALDNYQSALAGGASGEVIRTDGDAENSPLYRVVAHLSEPYMPPEQPKLPDAQLALIKKWIEQGALQNAGSPARPKKANVARVVVTTDRPAGPPPMPEKLPIEPLSVASRANGVTALAASPWAPLAAVSGHKQILLYNTSTNDLVGVLPFPEGQPHIMKFSRNGALLLVGGGRGAHSGKVVLFDVKTGTRQAEIGDEYDVILGADLSPDQSMVALGGPKKVVRCYSVDTGDLLYEMKKHTDWITTLEFSPDGVLLATGDRSNGVIVWEAGTGREFYSLNGHTGSITDISWAPDSNILATASEDGSVRLWEMQNGTQVKTWAAHSGGTLSMDFSRDARIVSAGRDLRGKLWDAGGTALKTYEPALSDLGTGAVVCAETDRVLIGDLTGVVHVYQAKDGVKVGELSTNPGTLTARIESAVKQLSLDEASVVQTTAQVKGIESGIEGRKQAAEVAAKLSAEAAASLDVMTQAKAAADKDLPAKRKAESQANQALQQADGVRAKSANEADSAKAAVGVAQSAVKSAQEALATTTNALAKSKETLAANPDEDNLKQAVTAAGKANTSAEQALAAAKEKLATAEKAWQQKNEQLAGATAALAAAKTAKDEATAARAVTEKKIAELATAIPMAVNLSNTRKAEAAKAAMAAQVTPELQKQLADSQAALKVASDRFAVSKERVARLQAAATSATQAAAR